MPRTKPSGLPVCFAITARVTGALNTYGQKVKTHRFWRADAILSLLVGQVLIEQEYTC